MTQELLKFTPAYCIVGIYRLITDGNVRRPVWDKCKHGVVRGAAVAGVWTFFTYGIQHAFVKYWLLKTPRFSTMTEYTLYGYTIPLATYATFIFMSSQITGIIKFFLSKNLVIAKTRAWDQVVASRGKGPDFWGPYVEEWERPPKVQIGGFEWEKWVGGWIGRYIIRNAIVVPLNLFVPFAGIPISAAVRSISTARYLHSPYFLTKKMTPLEIATYMEERKVAYYLFGFTAALLEMIPIAGLVFSISNRVGASMWAFDLEKRQHMFARGEKKPKPSRIVELDDGTSVELKPAQFGGKNGIVNDGDMAGGWVEGDDGSIKAVGGRYVSGEGVVADVDEFIFRGTSAQECEDFIRCVRRVAMTRGKEEDDRWIAHYAVSGFAGVALRWLEALDEEFQHDWRKLRKAMLQRWPDNKTEVIVEGFSVPLGFLAAWFNPQVVPSSPAAAPPPTPLVQTISSLANTRYPVAKRGYIRVDGTPSTRTAYLDNVIGSDDSFGTTTKTKNRLLVEIVAKKPPHVIKVLVGLLQV
ncbi:hypothetical protein FRC01_012888 [Tulasnella sp. 417]|nr:hypothetical protein FRC01_012888 [Tulasnella sp. 417]